MFVWSALCLRMMTSSNGNISALLALCAGNSPVPGEFPAQRPVTRSFDVFFDMRPNKRLSKQSWGWWFETPSRPYDVIVMDWLRTVRCPAICRHRDDLIRYTGPARKVIISDLYIDGSVRDCSNSIALAMELLQSCIKPSIYHSHTLTLFLSCYLISCYPYQGIPNKSNYTRKSLWCS